MSLTYDGSEIISVQTHCSPRKRQPCTFAPTNPDAEALTRILYLTNDSKLIYSFLLSRYAKLESSGTLQTFLQDPELPSTRPFLDDEIRASIDALNASTAAINKQNEVLTLQCKELKSQLRDDHDAGLRQKRALEQLHRRHGLEKQHTSVTVCYILLSTRNGLDIGSDRVIAGRRPHRRVRN